MYFRIHVNWKWCQAQQPILPHRPGFGWYSTVSGTSARRFASFTSPGETRVVTKCEKRRTRQDSSVLMLRSLQVEKSLQRIQNGQRNSMYTSQQSVENKVGGVPGWQALLTAVGFRLDSAGPGIPAAVFFPTADPGDRLQQCSTTLQSLLGMSFSTLILMKQQAWDSFVLNWWGDIGCLVRLTDLQATYAWLPLIVLLRSPTTSSPGLVQAHHSFRSRRAANQPGRPPHLSNPAL